MAIESLGEIADVQLSTGPQSTIYDFETGDTSRWDTVNDLSAQSSTVYDGSYSGRTDNVSQSSGVHADVIPPNLSGGNEISKFEFIWRETTDQRGGGLRLRNSNGNVELGLATNNPQWDIIDNNGREEVFAGNGYNFWIRYTVTFDWTNGTFSVDFEDLDNGDTYTDSGRPLMNGQDIEKIVLETYNGGNWVRSTDDLSDMWWDNIRVEY